MSIDAVVVGAGPNGLVAAITLARAGRSVVVVEANDHVGGGTRSAALTGPGFLHDVCSAIHPLAAGSPVLSELALEEHGLRWCQPEIALAHPLDGGRAAVVERDVDATAERFSGRDRRAWRRHVGTHAERWAALAPMIMRPLPQIPRHPYVLARFGLPALLPALAAGEHWFRGDEPRAVLAGCGAHSFVPLTAPLTASFALVLLASAHAVGWPVAEGGSQRIADALAAYLGSIGGRIETGRRVTSLDELPPSRAVLFDVAPRQLAAIAGDRLPAHYRRRLQRFRHGPGVFKVDYALDGPVPWANEACARAGTVHLGGTADEIAAAEAHVANGRHPARPFVLVAQQSVVDPTRAPAGQHTLWTYCHVPQRSTVDMTEAIEAQIERFAPGFRDRVLARHAAGPAWFEDHDASLIGGDISGGANDGLQLVFRPTIGRSYRTPDPSLFLCSASTPPGGGVHGMCGFYAARAALRGVLR